MHEMALAASLVELVEEQAKENGLSKVARVFLAIGALSAIEKDALDFGFDVACKGTIADGAELKVETVAGKGFCMACAEDVEVAARGEPCPKCGGYQWMLVAGDELRLVALEGG